MSNGNGSLRALRNVDYSDRELLLAMQRCERDDGTVLAAEVAEDLNINSNGKRTPAGTVSVRLSWMATHKPDCPRGCTRHFGYIQRIDAREYGGKATDPPRWVITDKGRMLMTKRLRKSVEAAIDGMEVGEQLLTLRRVTQRAYVEVNDNQLATAIRREWQHQSARRPRLSR